jgi:hypothetical protein
MPGSVQTTPQRAGNDRTVVAGPRSPPATKRSTISSSSSAADVLAPRPTRLDVAVIGATPSDLRFAPNSTCASGFSRLYARKARQVTIARRVDNTGSLGPT